MQTFVMSNYTILFNFLCQISIMINSHTVNTLQLMKLLIKPLVMVTQIHGLSDEEPINTNEEPNQ